ncbi:MAG: hypothetical protein ACI4NJ_11645 [Cellvibrio sp.]
MTFSIGKLALPPVPASGVVTPADIANAAHDNAAQAETTRNNILQLLQTLDTDGNPDNGIQIAESTGELFSEDNTPDITSETFDAAITTFLPEGVELVSEEAALAHFNNALQSQLFGSWVYSEGAGKRNVLTFIDADRYIIIHEHNDGHDQTAGSVEYGSYEWDITNKKLHVRMIGQSDASGGLWEEASANNGIVTHDFDVSGGQLVLGTPRDGQAIFERVIDSNNRFIGAWTMTEHGHNDEDNHGQDNVNVLTFLSSSEYVVAHTNNQESYPDQPNQPLSGEFGTYKLVDNRLQVTGATVDTDGDGGLYNAEDPSDQANETLTITPWGDLLFVDDNEGLYSFVRVGNFLAKLQDMDEEGSLGDVSVIRDSLGFDAQDIASRTFTTTVPHKTSGSSVFTFTFGEANADGESSVGVVVQETGKASESFTASWTVNTTGAVVITVVDGEETLTLTGAKLASETEDGAKILYSIESDEESSLWEATLTPVES